MEFWWYVTAIFLTTLLGGVIPFLAARARNFATMAVPFAAGFLTGASLFHLLPESYEIAGPRTGFAMLAGFAFFYLPQKFVLAHPCEEEDCDFHKLGTLAFLGIGIHAVIDGIAVGATEHLPDYELIFMAVITHKLPAAIALSFILIAGGLDRRVSLIYILLFSLATPLGAIATKLTLAVTSEGWIGLALGFSSGNFLAIAGSDLLRRIHDHHETQRLFRLMLIALGILVTLIGGHLH